MPRFRLIITSFLLIAALILGCIFEVFYQKKEEQEIPFEQFCADWQKKERQTQNVVKQLAERVQNGQWATLNSAKFGDDDTGFYLFLNGELIFWNNNQLGISTIRSLKNDQFCRLNNAFCVIKSQQVGDFIVVGVIKIKNDFKSTSAYIENGFASGFRLDSSVEVENLSPQSPYAIVSSEGNYLFSLVPSKKPAGSKLFYYLSIGCWTLFALLFFLLFYFLGVQACSKKRPILAFLTVAAATGTLLFSALQMGVPKVLYETAIFSPIYYGSGMWLYSLGHLFAISAFCCVAVAIFYFHGRLSFSSETKIKRALFQVVAQFLSLVFFAFIVWLITDISNNSSVELCLYSIENFSLFSLTIYLILACWLVAFVLFRHKILLPIASTTAFWRLLLQNIVVSLVMAAILALLGHYFFAFAVLWFAPLCSTVDFLLFTKRRNYLQLAVIVFLFANFVALSFFVIQEQKRTEKYRIIAENILFSSNGPLNLAQEMVLATIENEIQSDFNIQRYLKQKLQRINNEQLANYLVNHYFKKHFGAYNVEVQVLAANDKSNNRYLKMIEQRAVTQFYTRYFYSNEQIDSQFDYIGVFPYFFENNAVMLYIKLAQKDKKNFSYSGVLFEKNKNGVGTNVVAARYEGKILRWKLGNYEYPRLYDFGNTQNSVYHGNYKHYLFNFAPNTRVVVSEKRPTNFVAYWLFFTYLFALYFVVALLVNLALLRRKRVKNKKNFFAQIRFNFVIYMVICLVVFFAVSVFYIYTQYVHLQHTEQLNTTKYVKKEIENFFDENSCNENSTALDFLVHDLSKMYETEIHLYNANGELISTSAPYIFSMGFVSKLIHPMPYFSGKNSEFVQTEQIGTFRFPTSYAAILCHNRLQGYVCLPAFLGFNELKTNMFSLFAIFLNFYFGFVLLASLLSIFLSKRLSRPLKTVQQRMEAIQLGMKNEKIDYNYAKNDELGMLIVQYNNMVDKLAESVELLARQERELAWREMARQIAHEIKNPLTPMKLTIQQLQRMRTLDRAYFEENFAKTTGVLIEQIDNLSRIATEFSNFARMPETKLTRINLANKLETIVDLFKNSEQTEVSYSCSNENVFVDADSEQMTQLFNNLLKNALQSIPSDREGKISVELKVVENQAIVLVCDNGIGIPPEIQEKVFTPDFTTKSNGMGLGLCIVKKIVEASHGTISFVSQPHEGTQFEVKFPVANEK